MSEKKARPAVDWQAVERDYRAGLLSLREMSAAHGVSHVSIKKHADRAGWTRDLKAKIAAKADALVNSAVVNGEANSPKAVAESKIVEGVALAVANIRLAHRSDLARGRKLTAAMLAELEAQTADVPALVQLGEILRSPDERGVDRLNDIYRAVISLPERVKSGKLLAETQRIYVDKEREAYNVGEDKDSEPASAEIPDDPIEASRAYQRIMSGAPV